MITPQDASARNDAVDIHRSFIIQAPAGSGKTELLTQRFLRLLGTVQQPEHILAITFTKKAAHEMKDRILTALHNAAIKTPISSPHEALTRQFAEEALHQDDRLEWQIEAHPHRLRILTIDAFCQQLHHAIWHKNSPISFASIDDYPEKLYQESAEKTLDYAEKTPQFQTALTDILTCLDNRKDNLLKLLVDMLRHREQWLSAIFDLQRASRDTLEISFLRLAEHTVNLFHEGLPNDLLIALFQCVNKLSSLQSHHPFDYVDNVPLSIEQARYLASCVLTKEGKIRKSFDHYVGLVKTTCPKDIYDELKGTSKILLEQLSEEPGYQILLHNIQILPPLTYDEEQWAMLSSLTQLLPLLVSHLYMQFHEKHQVDFSYIAQSALNNLGEEEAPTELALFLDHQIHHVLMDEFQDTSMTQYALLRQLIASWPTDGSKTLFLVGDPMQSIYRFRQAEVGLFVQTKQHGIGGHYLHSRRLSANFRSKPAVLHWINQTFPAVLAPKDDITLGAIAYASADIIHEDDAESFVLTHQFGDKLTQAEGIAALIDDYQKNYPSETIAILVRSRGHLKEITSTLKKHNIDYNGTDIIKLTHQRHIHMLYALTRVIVQPHERLAWFIFLRSGLVGMSLNDIHALANINRHAALLSNMKDALNLNLLSEEGLTRLSFIYPIMENALHQRAEMPLYLHLQNILKKLHGDLLIERKHQDDMALFWDLVAQHETHGHITRFNEFETHLSACYGKNNHASNVHIMTIHKAKGLEFDTVILPSLGAAQKNSDKSLISILTVPTENNTALTLVSPIKSANKKLCSLSEFIQHTEREKNNYEKQRLFYVAATRAKKRLILTDYQEGNPKGFRALISNQSFEPYKDIIYNETLLAEEPLTRLPKHYYDISNTSPTEALTSVRQAFSSNYHERIEGVIIHKLLYWMSHQNIPPHFPKHLAEYLIRQEGMNQAESFLFYNQIEEKMLNFLRDDRAFWLLNAHKDARSELPILVEYEENTQTLIMDRTFIENDKRWIIDYKTGEDILALEKHQKQLEQYAFHWSSQEQLPIFCGIYYLKTNTWHEWEYINNK